MWELIRFKKFWHIWSRVQLYIHGPVDYKVINFIIKNSVILKMLQTNNGNNWPCSFQVVNNVKLITHDGRRPTTDEDR